MAYKASTAILGASATSNALCFDISVNYSECTAAFLSLGARRVVVIEPLPTRTLDLTLPNIALNKRAAESCVSQWSRGGTPEEDAGHAVNGNPEKDYGFHTGFEPYPWWMVDLGSAAQPHFIRIYNRDFVSDSVQLRASLLLVEVSNDGKQWKPLFHTRPGHLFGGYSGGSPLLWSAKKPVETRIRSNFHPASRGAAPC